MKTIIVKLILVKYKLLLVNSINQQVHGSPPQTPG